MDVCVCVCYFTPRETQTIVSSKTTGLITEVKALTEIKNN